MADKAPIPRPLSPHLQIYRWQLTMALSILHRIAGAALAVGTIVVIWGLLAAATGESAWNNFTTYAHSWLGLALMFGWSVALYYHLCNGIRHLLWDTGRLFKIQNAYRAGYVVLLATVLLTAATWWHVWNNYSGDEKPMRFVENQIAEQKLL